MSGRLKSAEYEPTAADLAAIDAEWPVIAAELEALDAEIRALINGPGLSAGRVRHARRVARATLRAVPSSAVPAVVSWVGEAA